MRLNGKVALVNGATRGHGRAMAERFAREGAQVVLAGRNRDRGEVVAAAIRDAGGDAHYVWFDVTDEEAVAAAVEQAVARYGRLTTLVNNVGRTQLAEAAVKRTTELSTAEWNDILLGSLTGSVFWPCKYAIPHLAAAGGGSIISISTGQSILGMGGFAAYGAAKAGVNSMMRTIAVEEAAQRIRANVILLGKVAKPDEAWADVNPRRLTRNATADDVAAIATWLASDESEIVTGQVVQANGGYAINGGSRV